MYKKMNNMIKGCIFDLDGVIVDTAKFHYIAWKQLAKELGFDFSLEDNERLKGVSRERSLEILLEIGNIKVADKEKQLLAQKKNKIYRQLISSLTPKDILPGVMDFLLQARDLNKKLAIASASKNTPLILERLQLDNFFDAVVDGNKITKAKPDPQVFIFAAKELLLNPEQCIVFEDAKAGIEAAKRANMVAIGVGDKKRLPKADINITSFENLNCKTLLEKIQNIINNKRQ